MPFVPPTVPPPVTPSATPTAADISLRSLESLHAQSMGRALSTLLDQVRSSRQALPHLASLESSLLQGSLICLDQASLTVLTKVSLQLASLPDHSEDEALRELQSALLGALDRKRPAEPEAQLEDLGGGLVEISEVSHSTFMAVACSETTMPMTLPQPFPDTVPMTVTGAP